jgi:hypothetical protein
MAFVRERLFPCQVSILTARQPLRAVPDLRMLLILSVSGSHHNTSFASLDKFSTTICSPVGEVSSYRCAIAAAISGLFSPAQCAAPLPRCVLVSKILAIVDMLWVLPKKG